MTAHRARKKAVRDRRKPGVTGGKKAAKPQGSRTVDGEKRAYSRSGFYAAKKALARFGQQVIDGRTLLGRALSQWQAALVSHLGGQDAISAQQQAVVDLAVRTKLLLDSIDAWLLQQPSLVNHRKRALLPVVLQRQQLADSLARILGQLGLERRAKPVPALGEYLEERYGGGDVEPGAKRT